MSSFNGQHSTGHLYRKQLRASKETIMIAGHDEEVLQMQPRRRSVLSLRDRSLRLAPASLQASNQQLGSFYWSSPLEC